MITHLFKKDALGKIMHYSIDSNKNIKYGHYLLGLNNNYVHTTTNKSISAVIKNKKDKGYKEIADYDSLTIKQIYDLLPTYSTDADECGKPMKCVKHPAIDFKYYPALGQPKVNGIRCTIRLGKIDDGLFGIKQTCIIKSHEGLILHIKHIEDFFMEYVFNCDNMDALVFDGELYIRGEHVTSINGACKNPNNSLHSRIQFVHFDFSIPDMSQLVREDLRNRVGIILTGRTKDNNKVFYMKHHISHDNTNINILNLPIDKAIYVHLSSKYIQDWQEAEEYRDDCLKVGYEGCVIRDYASEYKFGSRAKTMLKLKRFEVKVFEILDIIEYGEDRDGKVGKGVKFVLRNDLTEDTFESIPLGNTETRLGYLDIKHKLIHTYVKVRFYERTKNKIPLHANVILDDEIN